MPPKDPFGPDSEYLSPEAARRPDAGASPGPGRPRRRVHALLLVVLVLVLVESVIVLVNHRSGAGRRVDAGPTTAAPTTSVPTLSGPTQGTEVLGPPVWVTTNLAWVTPSGLTGGWDLFARGPGVVVRISPASGTVSRTGLPLLASSGPVSFVATPASTLIRPLDHVLGYVVPDGAPARAMPDALAADGPMLPSPDPGRVWVASPDDTHPALVLKSVAGGPAVARLPVPTDASVVGALPDGAGFALFATDHGLVDVRPGGSRVVSRGTLLATGPRSWLVRECVPLTRCTSVLVAQASLARTDIGVPTRPEDTGAISPDGRFAAIVHGSSTAGPPALSLVNLTSAAVRVLPLAVSSGPGDSIVWSPDSRSLFVVFADTGGIVAVDAVTGSVEDLGVTLPTPAQLAIRPAP